MGAAIAAHLAHANTEYRHPFLIRREGVKDVGIIVVTSDKGLCGGLNTNALRVISYGGAETSVLVWNGSGVTRGPHQLALPAHVGPKQRDLARKQHAQVDLRADVGCLALTRPEHGDEDTEQQRRDQEPGEHEEDVHAEEPGGEAREP